MQYKMGEKLEELIIKAQKGDKEAFTEIILSIKNDLYKIAKIRINNNDDIEDIIQETMIEAYKCIKKLKEPKKFKQWTISILINRCNKFYTKKYRDESNLEEFNFDTYKNINISNEIEDNLNFYYLISELKYEERIIALLYYMEKYTADEIADILKMNKNTIRTHLSRARQKLKNILDKEELK